jgi:hypothetical protein
VSPGLELERLLLDSLQTTRQNQAVFLFTYIDKVWLIITYSEKISYQTQA